MATFYGFFTASKQGKTGLTVTADIYSASWMLEACTEIGGGLYTISYTTRRRHGGFQNNRRNGQYAMQHVAALTAAMAAL